MKRRTWDYWKHWRLSDAMRTKEYWEDNALDLVALSVAAIVFIATFL